VSIWCAVPSVYGRLGSEVDGSSREKGETNGSIGSFRHQWQCAISQHTTWVSVAVLEQFEGSKPGSVN
jgi:hypothetical protein